MTVRNGCRSTDRNHGVTKAWLPQKARFYAGLRVFLGGVTMEPSENTIYIQKKIFYNLCIYFNKDLEKMPRA